MRKPDTTVRTTVDLEDPEDGDWEAFDSLSEEDIHAAALRDPDNPPLTEEQLSRMRRAPDVRRIRDSMGLSQTEFGRRFDIPLATLQDWEQGSRLNRAARNLMYIIAYEPDAVDRALAMAKNGSPDSR